MALRQTVWIDRDVQGQLVGRVVIYWAFGLLYVVLGTACIQYYQHPDWSVEEHASLMFSQMWPWLPSVLLCLPLVIFDIVRLSNAFVGPVYRLRKHLAELNEDPNCVPLSFRTEDCWQDIVEPMHRLQAEILVLRAELTKLHHDKMVANTGAEFLVKKGEASAQPAMDVADTDYVL